MVRPISAAQFSSIPWVRGFISIWHILIYLFTFNNFQCLANKYPSSGFCSLPLECWLFFNVCHKKMLNNIFTCRETPKNLLATVQKIEVSMTMNSDSDYIMELNDIKKTNANRTTKKNSSQKYRQLLSYKKKLSHSICLKLSYFIAFAIEEFAHKYGFSIAQLNAFLPFDTFILFHPFFFASLLMWVCSFWLNQI